MRQLYDWHVRQRYVPTADAEPPQLSVREPRRQILDVGTGQSKLTWQGIVGVGYAFNWGSIVAAWRYLDYEFKSGSPVENLSFNGPAIGLIFRW